MRRIWTGLGDAESANRGPSKDAAFKPLALHGKGPDVTKSEKKTPPKTVIYIRVSYGSSFYVTMPHSASFIY